ncbi:MAG: phosphate signaling complex protein PhoU [Firmicutes bacterium]|jgi:phosphate transport system regulatory protein phoU|nr:phosphate signaling complex protein PhoU [Clostridia bacterium]MBS5023714.1 phosphate signaling complex protein PhoU [Bacillota bacterium]HAL20653.1 phosphate transport system regulatory protein PhoU [Oscillospiraceae bacterium]
MRTTYLSELKELKMNMLQMGSDIEDAIKNTMKALRTDDLIMAQEVINKDCIIDDAERTIENLCLKLLLTQQPVATDMRMISSALKMITDMERIGDFAADIAEIITKGGRTGTSYNIDFVDRMGEAVIRMVDSAVLSFTNTDLDLAKQVCKADDEVDGLFNGAKNALFDCIRKDEQFAERALDLMLVSKYLERIGDHATNIAEWVIFSITGVHVNTENGY